MAKFRGKRGPFDPLRWKARIGEAYKLVANDYPDGFLDWAKERDPAVVEKLRAAVDAVKEAYMEGDDKKLGWLLICYLRAHYQAFDDYRERG
jgi:hypothetical protein